MSRELSHRIRSAQIRAGEDAVITHLHKNLEWQDPDASLTHAEYYRLHGTLNDWRIQDLLCRDDSMAAQSGVSSLLWEAEESYPGDEFLKDIIEDARTLASQVMDISETIDADEVAAYVEEELMALVDRLEAIQEGVKICADAGTEALQEARKSIYVP